jgi:hypothetical protein
MPSHNPDQEHRQGDPRPPEAVCLIITVVGATRAATLPADVLDSVRRTIESALAQHIPDFLPAQPAVTVIWHDVRDDWIGRGPADV